MRFLSNSRMADLVDPNKKMADLSSHMNIKPILVLMIFFLKYINKIEFNLWCPFHNYCSYHHH